MVVLCYTFHSMSLNLYGFISQFYYTNMVVVHAIFIVINIEFSGLIGDYLSAKFEL
ncbi:hypothetical protein SAMN05660742_105142 [Propionispira arboris]|uniref:Uncharacterized protein n=1 Tax=Propionispira arboris TaxID=84035 RepID=A0A1H6XVD7_9FIRM|nr:hypothetical protein SAMN05660742_105142 [Propionispira arboris]